MNWEKYKVILVRFLKIPFKLFVCFMFVNLYAVYIYFSERNMASVEKLLWHNYDTIMTQLFSPVKNEQY